MYKRSSHLRNNFAVLSGTPNSWTAGGKPRVYDVYDILESIAWTWRVFGIFPFTIRCSIGPKKYRLNKFYAVYSSLLAALCIMHFVYMMSRHVTKFSVVSTTVLIRTLASLLCMIVFSILRICRYKELEDSIETMASQAAMLEKLNCHVNFKTNEKLVGAYVWTSLMTIMWISFYDIFVATHFFGRLHFVVFIFPLIGQIIDLTILVTLIGLLGLQFRAINDKIRTVITRANASSPKIIITSDVCAENLRRLAKVHYNLCTLGKRINSFFDLDVIINVITAFVILSTTLYYIFVEVNQDGKTNYVRIVKYIQIELVHSLPIIIIVAICNWTTHQSMHTGNLIHEIRIEKIESRLYEAVKSFSLQLHHQNLQFTAGGFFPLNPTLIQTSHADIFAVMIINERLQLSDQIVGNITTYLVLLIQFQPSMD